MDLWPSARGVGESKTQPKVTIVHNNHLIDPVSKSKIENVLKNMCCDKASGPDGFLALFFRISGTVLSMKLFMICSIFSLLVLCQNLGIRLLLSLFLK